MSGFDTTDMGRLAADFDASSKRAATMARLVAQKTAADIKADAQNLAPVDTGALRSSITYDTRALVGAVEAEVGPTMEYGNFLEEGTSVQPPQPYMGPAFDRRVGSFLDAMGRIADL